MHRIKAHRGTRAAIDNCVSLENVKFWKYLLLFMGISVRHQIKYTVQTLEIDINNKQHIKTENINWAMCAQNCDTYLISLK